jgi:light-regulated signal transduction histidine kinase (bacteriophytochrome)
MHEPLTSATDDRETLQDLGRACAEIVHDVRNELNALKLYATFLLKRSEKSKWLPDERETLTKLLSGLERSAGDLTMLVHYSRPIEPEKKSGISVQQIVESICSDRGLRARLTGDLEQALVAECDSGDFRGEFDLVLLTQAFRAITLGVLKQQRQKRSLDPIKIRLSTEESESGTVAVVDWECDGLNMADLLVSVGTTGVCFSLAARILEAHRGTIERHSKSLRARLPLSC